MGDWLDKIGVVISTKAELIKMFPVINELDRRKVPYSLIHVGQHDLAEQLKEFHIRKPDVVVKQEKGFVGRQFIATAKAIFWNLTNVFRLVSLFRRLKLDKLVVHGDTMSAATAAIASKLCFRKITLYHVEAGLRSHDLLEPFPEELARVIVDNLCDVAFAVSDVSASNIKKEHLKCKVHVVGNTMIDALMLLKNRINGSKEEIPKQKYALVSIHRYENIHSKERLDQILAILGMLPVKIIWPMHTNTENRLKEFALLKKHDMKNIEIHEPKDFLAFQKLMQHCALVVADGGSIQEETSYYRIPCIVLRKKTERVESVGLNAFITELDFGKAKEAMQTIASKQFNSRLKKTKCPYGNGKSRKKIVDVISGGV